MLNVNKTLASFFSNFLLLLSLCSSLLSCARAPSAPLSPLSKPARYSRTLVTIIITIVKQSIDQLTAHQPLQRLESGRNQLAAVTGRQPGRHRGLGRRRFGAVGEKRLQDLGSRVLVLEQDHRLQPDQRHAGQGAGDLHVQEAPV